MGETGESKSRKAVQMNCLARSLSVSLSTAVFKVCEDFGEINHEYVTIDDFLPGDFQKYINSNFSMYLKSFEITQKAETYVHCTYEKSYNRLMITDLQGVGYHLCDPKIAT